MRNFQDTFETRKRVFISAVSVCMKTPVLFNFIKKETPTQVFSCEFCEIFTNIFFHRTPPVTASVT